MNESLACILYQLMKISSHSMIQTKFCHDKDLQIGHFYSLESFLTQESQAMQCGYTGAFNLQWITSWFLVLIIYTDIRLNILFEEATFDDIVSIASVWLSSHLSFGRIGFGLLRFLTQVYIWKLIHTLNIVHCKVDKSQKPVSSNVPTTAPFYKQPMNTKQFWTECHFFWCSAVADESAK